MRYTDEQWGLVLGYPSLIVAIQILFFTPLIRPLRIFAIALHELAHALTACLLCGRVHEVSVDRFEGGVTVWSPRCVRVSLPIVSAAGYIGGSLFGGALLLSLHDPPLTTLLLRVLFVLLVLAAAIVVRRPALRLDAAWLACFGALGALCSWRPDAVLTKLYVPYTAAVLCSYAAYDVYDDTVSRVLPDSDASQFAAATCGRQHARAVGVAWYAICTAIHAAAFVATFVLLGGRGEAIELQDATRALYLPFTALLWATIVLAAALVLAARCVARAPRPAA